MPYRRLVPIPLLACLPLCLVAQTVDLWAEFDKPPLTILYPEDESLSNPPFFHWQVDAAAAEYELVLSSATGESNWRAKQNFFTPAQPLAAGTYRIQVLAFDAAGARTGASAPHEFKIAGGRSGIAADLNAIPLTPGAPILFPDADIKAIQSAIGERAQFRDRLLESARQPRPSLLDEFTEPPPYPDGKYNYDHWNKINNLCFTLEDYSLRQALAYRLTGDRAFAERCKALLLDAARWAPRGSTGVWSSDHSAWSVLHFLCVGYRMLETEWTPEERTFLRAAIENRSRDMYRFLNPFVGKVTIAGMMNDPDNNHPWFCAAALGFGGLTLQGETTEASEWIEFTAQIFHGVFLPRGGGKGGWHEGIDYWSYTLYFVFQYCDALKTATGVDLYKHPWLQNTAFFKTYVHPPRGGYVPFGDCKHHQPTGFDKLVMMRLASEYIDPVAWKYVDAIQEDIGENRLFHALQWSDRAGVVVPENVDLPFAREFTDIGWVVSNTSVFDVDNQILFAFRSGRFFGRRFGHSHADQNSFILTAGGDKLLWDAGYYDSYLSPHHRGYSSRSEAHNVILVGGAGQVPFTSGTDGKITEFECKDHSLHVQGDASKSLIYGGRLYQWQRTIDFTDQKNFVVSDLIWLAENDTVSWLLHSAYPILFNPATRSITITGDHYQLTGVFETDVPVDAILTTTFPEPPGQRARQYNDPKDNPYPDQYHLELRTTRKLEIWKPTLRMTLSPRNAAANPVAPADPVPPAATVAPPAP